MRETECAEPRPPSSARASKGVRNRGVVVTCPRGTDEDPHTHESVTRRAIAQRLAELKGYGYAGDYDRQARYGGRVYFVPAETLVGLEAAHALGIRTEHDLFGGVVPFAFVGTKTIGHPLLNEHAAAPRGWSAEFTRRVADAVLPGYAAFTMDDARAAGERLLARGSVRIKPALGIGGRGQVVAENANELSDAVHALESDTLARCGVVVEQNLDDVTTYSVGQVHVGRLTASYFGKQKLTTDNAGAEVYGGSDLTVARGDYDALLQLEIEPGVRLAVEQARIYDTAAGACFRGFFASRRNYDVARGLDRDGTVHSGVLEQSWRIGGASGPEVAALAAFAADPELKAVQAHCSEVYGASVSPPRDAHTFFRGVDPTVGFITKYTTLKPYVHA